MNTLFTSARTPHQSTWHERHKDQLTGGDRAADAIRNLMGSWPFVIGFLATMGVWALINSGAKSWDPYPFILLNLLLSTLAGMQGAILLIAAKRQDGLSAALAAHDRETNLAAKADIEALLEINRQQSERIDAMLAILEAKKPAARGKART